MGRCFAVRGGLLHLAHDAEEVSAPYLFEIGLAEAVKQQVACEVEQFLGRGAAPDASVAVEVGSDAHVVDTGHVDHVA